MAKIGRMVKEASVEELATRLSEQPNFFVTALDRLPASEADLFRQKLFTSQSRFVLIKRRLGHRAIERLKISGLDKLLEGSVGFVLAGEDPLLTAKLIVDFRKEHEKQLTVRGAVINGELLDTGRVEELAALPPKPVLLAQVIATLESPISELIFTVEQLIGDVCWLVEQVAAAKPAEPAAEKPAEPSQAQEAATAKEPSSSASAQAAPEPPAKPDAPPPPTAPQPPATSEKPETKQGPTTQPEEGT